MIHSIHQTIFIFHVILGSVALISFWFPIIATKGSTKHKISGKVFAYAMYTVAISGLLMTTMALAMPIATYAIDLTLEAAKLEQYVMRIRTMNSFLFMLSLLVLTSTYHAMTSVKVKTDRSSMRTTRYQTPIVLLGITGIAMLLIGIDKTQYLYMIFGGISIGSAIGTLRYIHKKTVTANAWLIEHFSGLIGAGIGAYTAFFAFGGRRLLSEVFVGNLQLIPWVLPSIIGVSYTYWLIAKYQSKNQTNTQSVRAESPSHKPPLAS